MPHPKRITPVHRLRSRVRELQRQAAPWTKLERARKQLRKVEAKTTRTVKE